MAVARAVASSSAFLACAFALASALSDFFRASVVVRSASVRLRVVALPGYLLVGLGLLRPRLVIGQLENLGDALTDLLVRGLGAERLLACGGQVALQFLAVVQGPGKSLFQVADLAAAAGDELVHLTAAVPAHLHFEGVFVNKVRQEITVVIHGFPRSCWSM